MKEQVKALWKLCFPEDSDSFVELYFDSRYNDEINSCISGNGRIVSALQRIPYPMHIFDKDIPIAYISGACTHPDFRSRGLMSELLDKAHRKMFVDGKYLSVLIPANESLVGYYAKSGYEVTFQQERELLTCSCEIVNNVGDVLTFRELSLIEYDLSEMCDFINQQLSTYSASILHPLQDMKIVVSDLYLSGGKVLLGRNKAGELCSIALFIIVEKGIVIKELLAVDKQTETDSLNFIFSHYSVSRAEKYSPCGMVRVINAYGVMELIACRMEGDYVVEVYGDYAITENNGFYLVTDSKCIKMDSNNYINDAEYLRLHINNMPSMLFAGVKPYMSLMLD